jgi:GDP-L-fucose synthase
MKNPIMGGQRMKKDAKIYLAGHTGLLGSAIARRLSRDGYTNVVLRTHAELDLTKQADVMSFFRAEKPEYVFLAAAKVGGIQANAKSPADFFFINSMIYENVIHSAYATGVKKLLFFGSSCIYPKECPQPIREESLLSGRLEPTNEGFAIAKIAGLKMCAYYKEQYGANFISCMFTNLYGPNDNFDLEGSHVLPALINKFHTAKEKGEKSVVLWGSGKPLREFLYVDDAADAGLFLMDNYSGLGHINVGTGEDISIHDLALMIKEKVGFEGELVFDASKPDGTFRKQLDVSKINGLGWKHSTSLDDGLTKTLEWYRDFRGQRDFARD